MLATLALLASLAACDGGDDQPAGDPAGLGGLHLDPDTLQVSAGGRPILLGPIEFRLLAFLMRHPERVHSRPQLLDRVWGRHAVLDERTVDTHVGRLRQALRSDGRATLCLPGGTTPAPLFSQLSELQLEWDRVTVFPGDERCVPPADARSNARLVRHNGQEVPLTRKEFDLLHYLLLHRGRVLTRLQLGEHLWGNVLEDDSDSNYIDVHIKNVRKKLAQFGPADFLETVRGIGYRAAE